MERQEGSVQKIETKLMKPIILPVLLVWLAAAACGNYWAQSKHDGNLVGKLILLRACYSEVDTNPEKAADNIAFLLGVHVEEYRQGRKSFLRRYFLRWDSYRQTALGYRWDRIIEIATPDKSDTTGSSLQRPP